MIVVVVVVVVFLGFGLGPGPGAQMASRDPGAPSLYPLRAPLKLIMPAVFFVSS